MLTLLGSLYSNFSFAVALASIPELPAETCKEIKTSEFGQVVSGKYWFSGIKQGMPVLAHCDMETEGEACYEYVVELRPQIARNVDQLTWVLDRLSQNISRLKHHHFTQSFGGEKTSLQTTAY